MSVYHTYRLNSLLHSWAVLVDHFIKAWPYSSFQLYTLCLQLGNIWQLKDTVDCSEQHAHHSHLISNLTVNLWPHYFYPFSGLTDKPQQLHRADFESTDGAVATPQAVPEMIKHNGKQWWLIFDPDWIRGEFGEGCIKLVQGAKLYQQIPYKTTVLACCMYVALLDST